MRRINKRRLKKQSPNLINFINKTDHCACWDGYYLYGLVYAKLSDFERFYSNPKNYSRIKGEWRYYQIKRVKSLFECAITHKFSEGNHARKYMNLKTCSRDLCKDYNNLLKEEQDAISRGTIDTPYESFGEKTCFRDLLDSAFNELYESKALALGFKLLGQYVQSWWD